MTTTTTHSARPERVNSVTEVDGTEGMRFYTSAYYPARGLRVTTMWWRGYGYHPDGATTEIKEELTGLPGTIYRKDYDPTRVTVGGLAEAHEAVCARVEQGELP